MPEKIKFKVQSPEKEPEKEPETQPEIETWEGEGGTVEMEEDFDKPE